MVVDTEVATHETFEIKLVGKSNDWQLLSFPALSFAPNTRRLLYWAPPLLKRGEVMIRQPSLAIPSVHQVYSSLFPSPATPQDTVVLKLTFPPTGDPHSPSPSPYSSSSSRPFPASETHTQWTIISMKIAPWRSFKTMTRLWTMSWSWSGAMALHDDLIWERRWTSRTRSSAHCQSKQRFDVVYWPWVEDRFSYVLCLFPIFRTLQSPSLPFLSWEPAEMWCFAARDEVLQHHPTFPWDKTSMERQLGTQGYTKSTQNMSTITRTTISMKYLPNEEYLFLFSLFLLPCYLGMSDLYLVCRPHSKPSSLDNLVTLAKNYREVIFQSKPNNTETIFDIWFTPTFRFHPLLFSLSLSQPVDGYCTHVETCGWLSHTTTIVFAVSKKEERSVNFLYIATCGGSQRGRLGHERTCEFRKAGIGRWLTVSSRSRAFLCSQN